MSSTKVGHVFKQFHLILPCGLGIGGMDEARRFQSESFHARWRIFFPFLIWLIGAIVFIV
jgi:hypothetical protein